MKKTIKKAQIGKLVGKAVKAGSKALVKDVEKNVIKRAETSVEKPLSEWQKKAGYTKTLTMGQQKAKKDLQKAINKRTTKDPRSNWFDEYFKKGGTIKKAKGGSKTSKKKKK